MITKGIKASNVTNNNRLNLGDWDSKSSLDTRPSDWMMSHLRAFYEFTGDKTWLTVINNLYDVYTQFSNKYSKYRTYFRFRCKTHHNPHLKTS